MPRCPGGVEQQRRRQARQIEQPSRAWAVTPIHITTNGQADGSSSRQRSRSGSSANGYVVPAAFVRLGSCSRTCPPRPARSIAACLRCHRCGCSRGVRPPHGRPARRAVRLAWLAARSSGRPDPLAQRHRAGRRRPGDRPRQHSGRARRAAGVGDPRGEAAALVAHRDPDRRIRGAADLRRTREGAYGSIRASASSTGADRAGLLRLPLALRQGSRDLRRPAGPLFTATLASAIGCAAIGAVVGDLDLTPSWAAQSAG